MKIENCSFGDAVEKVKGTGWVEGSRKVKQVFQPLPDAPKNYDTVKLSDLAAAERSLEDSVAGRNWLQSRCISLETAKKHHLGFVQDCSKASPGHELASKGWILVPTVMGEKVTCLKYRSVAAKAFVRKPNMETCLYNVESIDPFEDIFVVEGEIDSWTMTEAGYNSVALPSAQFSVTAEVKDRLLQANRIFLAGDTDSPGQQCMHKLWTELRDQTYLLKWPDAKDANEILAKTCKGDVKMFHDLVEELKAQSMAQPMPYMHDLARSMYQADDVSPMDNPLRLRFPWPKIDQWTSIVPGDVMVLSATETGTGKALKNGTPILTPSGWVAIEDLKVGNYVMGRDGYPTKVLGVFPQGTRPVYQVAFSCGTEIVCDEDHLWTLETTNHNRSRTFTTKEMSKMRFPISAPWKVPEIAPVRLNPRIQTLHPYLVGVLIGDGGLTHTSVMVSCADQEILDRISVQLPDGITIKHSSAYDYRLSNKDNRGGNGKTSKLKDALRELRLLGVKSENKTIPLSYLLGSIEQRLELLRGLLDTDGTVDHRTGAISFCSSSEILARQVCHLVFSLGGFAAISPKETDRLPSNIVSVNLPPDMRVFWLARKHELASKRKGWRRVRAVRSVVPCGSAETTCIKVEADDGLFITKDFIPTHNTSWLMDVLLENSINYGKVVVNYSAELPPAQYARRAAAYLTGVNKDQLKRPDFELAAAKMSEAKFYNGYKPGANYKDVVELLRWAKRRLGADILVVDHLHFLTRGEKDEIKAQSEAMREMKDLAIEYGVIMIVVGQPRKPKDEHFGRELQMRGIKGSESLGSDASQVFILHRKRIKDAEGDDAAVFSPETKVILDKSRESEARVTKLLFRGEICSFSEMANGGMDAEGQA